MQAPALIWRHARDVFSLAQLSHCSHFCFVKSCNNTFSQEPQKFVMDPSMELSSLCETMSQMLIMWLNRVTTLLDITIRSPSDQDTPPQNASHASTSIFSSPSHPHNNKRSISRLMTGPCPTNYPDFKWTLCTPITSAQAYTGLCKAPGIARGMYFSAECEPYEICVGDEASEGLPKAYCVSEVN